MENNLEEQFKLKFSSGFTLVEVMVAVAILSIGLIGGLTAITNNLKNISSQKNKIVASGLVEDGMERVRNVRDTNWLKGEADWKHDIEGTNSSNKTVKFFCGDNGHQQIPSSPQTFSDCGENCRVYIYTKTINPGIGTQCYSDDFNKPGYSKVATSFYRLITLVEKSSDSVEVKVNVKWTSGEQTYNLTATEILYNWK